MKILFVSQYYSPEPFSNATVVNSLVARGNKVEVLTAVPNYPQGVFYSGYSSGSPMTEVMNGVKVHRVRTVSRGTTKLRLLLNYLAFVWFGMFHACFGRFERPDVVFLSQLSPVLMALPAIVLSRRFNVPLVYWVQDIWPESAVHTLGLRNKLLVKLLNILCGWLYRRADFTFVQSSAFPPMISRYGVPRERIAVFPNTAEEHYRPVNLRHAEAALLPKTGFKIMFAGNIGESQDFDTIIEAAKMLKYRADIQWIVIGSGRDCERVQYRVKQFGLDDIFHFLGRYPSTQMPYFFAHADAMLVSLLRNDIFALTVPYKVQSYMACGKPIIGSLDGEGARIIREAGAGLCAEPQSPASFSEAVITLVEASQDQRDQMAEASRSYFLKNYHQTMVFDQLESNLRRFIDDDT
ncbi:glycosyltransferase family 4 protein [Paracoccaceae bacterium]|nr:glycosyltransferase family 4 protein [Paracoccaceae bacterium]